MRDNDVGLDVLDNFEVEHDLPFKQLGLEMDRIFTLKVSISQIDAIVNRKPVAWPMITAWYRAGISESVIKSFRRHMMEI